MTYPGVKVNPNSFTFAKATLLTIYIENIAPIHSHVTNSKAQRQLISQMKCK